MCMIETVKRDLTSWWAWDIAPWLEWNFGGPELKMSSMVKYRPFNQSNEDPTLYTSMINPELNNKYS